MVLIMLCVFHNLAVLEGGEGTMQTYVRPEILATYTEEELVEEAAECVIYEPIP